MNQQKTLPITVIFPNPNQPREYFNAEKMFQIRESLRREGIISPLVVMDNEDGTYMIVDGERRYRSAVELGYTEVPVVIEAKMDDVQMRIRQFQVQQYHEEWTPIEKAKSIIVMSDALNMTLTETCKMLGVTPRDMRTYVAFAELADKSAYVASETPLHYVESIKGFKAVVRRVASTELDAGLSHNDERILEGRIIEMVKNGTLKNRAHMTKISDAVRKEPEVLKRLLDTSQVIDSPEQLFREAKAKGAHALRNVVYNARYITQHTKAFLDANDVKITPEEFDVLIRARDALTKVIDIA